MDTPAATLPSADIAASIPLRDWFAGQVVAAILVAPRVPGVPRLDMDGMASMAYDFADAMLRARAGLAAMAAVRD